MCGIANPENMSLKKEKYNPIRYTINFILLSRKINTDPQRHCAHHAKQRLIISNDIKVE